MYITTIFLTVNGCFCLRTSKIETLNDISSNGQKESRYFLFCTEQSLSSLCLKAKNRRTGNLITVFANAIKLSSAQYIHLRENFTHLEMDFISTFRPFVYVRE
jgi:hypothetical protein